MADEQGDFDVEPVIANRSAATFDTGQRASEHRWLYRGLGAVSACVDHKLLGCGGTWVLTTGP